MADFPKLLAAAKQAYEAGARDLAVDFLRRAIEEVGVVEGGRGVLPWSTVPSDERYDEFRRRALLFLRPIAAQPNGEIVEADAKALARRVFREQPRVVGPTFYRAGLVNAMDSASIGPAVRITPEGRRFLQSLELWEREHERGAAS